jgi:RNA polymerase sigma factor (sigma-70 family)
MTEEDFNQAITDNFAKLVRTAGTVLYCESAAKDAVQQAVIRVWKNITTFDPKKGSFVTLLHVAVKRQAIGHIRSRIRRVAAMEFFWAETIVAERPREADPRGEGLLNALGELPEKKQALLRKRASEARRPRRRAAAPQ